VAGEKRCAPCNCCFQNVYFGYDLTAENVGGNITAFYDFPGDVPCSVEINYGAGLAGLSLGYAGSVAGSNGKPL